MSQESATLNGHQVTYDDSLIMGIRYLSQIGFEESKVFFDEAYNKGYAVFEDHMGSKFKLVHSGGAYQLVKN